MPGEEPTRGDGMDEPGKELELVVPQGLRRLAAQTPVDVPDIDALVRARRRGIEPYGERGLEPIGPTAQRRLRRMAREERGRRPAGYVLPTWWGLDEPVPGLLISMRYSRQDLHGITVRTRDLDIAFRRAAATLNDWRSGNSSEGWAYPMRPERGGLWALDSRRGSYEVFATVYGSLVGIALSNPVALAGLVSLAFDAKAAVSRAGIWIGHLLQNGAAEPPALGTPADGEAWSAENTKALEPVMLAAIESGAGFEFVNKSASGEIRISIPAQAQLQRGDGAD